MGGIICLLARNKMCHLRESINYYKYICKKTTVNIESNPLLVLDSPNSQHKIHG